MSWRQEQTAILTPSSSSTIAALLSHLGWVAQSRVTEGCKPSVCKLILPLASCLQLTQAVCAQVILLFNVHLLPLFFRLFTQVHLLIDGSVEGQYITIVVTTSLSANKLVILNRIIIIIIINWKDNSNASVQTN